ncbi:LysM peptidoglycan-binding domain-containing protein [bacterium]|nr:LysM peptidoglycan-binding domain-containing protein [bacterium]
MNIHVVQSDTETLEGISEQYNMPVDELYLINGLNEGSVLHVGQKINLSHDPLLNTLLFGIDDYHSPDCSGCNGDLANCGNNDCECECESVSGTTPCTDTISCS